MFEVLAYLYHHYWHADTPPDPDHLADRLLAQGFADDHIEDAQCWLDDLRRSSEWSPVAWPIDMPSICPSARSTRVYTAAEHHHLGRECLGLVSQLPHPWHERVMDRAMATPGSPIHLDELQLIIVMVCWQFGMLPQGLALQGHPAFGRPHLPH
jgi:Smg protein